MVWRVAVAVKGTTELEYWTADIVCQCIGTLDRPKWGNTPGREKFAGASWHTAHWRGDYDLTGKRVAIVGCGPSAAQIIPEIVDKTKHLTVYMRTPPVCIPRGDFQYSL
jgi:cation diffusion facilitator CzcD-associated flavoprotein CzcO